MIWAGLGQGGQSSRGSCRDDPPVPRVPARAHFPTVSGETAEQRENTRMESALWLGLIKGQLLAGALGSCWPLAAAMSTAICRRVTGGSPGALSPISTSPPSLPKVLQKAAGSRDTGQSCPRGSTATLPIRI